MFLVRGDLHRVPDGLFADGERIGTEHSHKYTIEQFARIARGFEREGLWTDPKSWFCVQLLRPRPWLELQVGDDP